MLEDRIDRLENESALLRTRFLRVRGRRRPHYRRNECMDILWHAARYRLSVHQTAHTFAWSVRTVLTWHRVLRRKDPPLQCLADFVCQLVHRIKASRSSVQRILRRGRTRPAESELVTASRGRGLLARRPNHIWMIDFTRIGGVVRPLWVGVVIDVFSRRVLAILRLRLGA